MVVLRPLATGDVLAGSPGARDVTVLVPARNEEEVIGRSARALLTPADRGRIASVVVVDDGSTDRTGAILEAVAREPGGERLRILLGRGPGPGQCGKPAALAFAIEEVRPETEWLLFVDADVVFVPGAIDALLARAEDARVDLVSVIPRIEMERPIEKLVMPSVGALVLSQFPPRRIADPADPTAFANGQVILIRRTVYERAGGHAAVSSEILEDVRLAERVKRVGGRLLLADGRYVASTRMYAGWRELEEGWSKNLFLIFGSRAPRAIGWAVFSVALAWSGVLLLLAYGWPVGLGAYAAVLAFQAALRSLGGASPAWAVLAPVSALLTAWLLLRSTYVFLARAPVAWKGRAYGPRP